MTDFLFARPSFWEGVARIMDFGNTLQEYNRPSTPEEEVWRAIESDWIAVGKDMQAAIDKVAAQINLKEGNA